MNRAIGDLTPIRAALDALEAWERHDRANRGEADPVVTTLARVRRELAEALAEAVQPIDGLTVEEYAEKEGITVFGAYKRIARGKVPVERRAGRLFVQIAA
jgi:hypothetical protein